MEYQVTGVDLRPVEDADLAVLFAHQQDPAATGRAAGSFTARPRLPSRIPGPASGALSRRTASGIVAGQWFSDVGRHCATGPWPPLVSGWGRGRSMVRTHRLLAGAAAAAVALAA